MIKPVGGVIARVDWVSAGSSGLRGAFVPCEAFVTCDFERRDGEEPPGVELVFG